MERQVGKLFAIRIRSALVLLPILLSGCCTWLTTDYATHAYRSDTVSRIERAAVTTNELVIWVDGARSESPRQKKFTVAVMLPANDNGAWVPQSGMTEGWNRELLDQPGALPVTIGQNMVIGADRSALSGDVHLPATGGAERALYLVRHEKPDKQTSLLYVVRGEHPQEIEIRMDSRNVKTPGRYPLLIFVPVTLAVDVAAFPFEIYFFATYGDHYHYPESRVIKNP